MPHFEIPSDACTHLSLFDLPEGLPNISKTCENTSVYFNRRHPIMYKNVTCSWCYISQIINMHIIRNRKLKSGLYRDVLPA